MRSCRSPATALLLLAACSAPTPAVGTVDAAAKAPAPAAATAPSWRASMQQLGELAQAIERELGQPGHGDGQRIATAARAAAGLLRPGHTGRALPSVPGFADHARAAESFLLQVAMEASLGHGDLAAEAWQAGRKRHCTDCHLAAEQAGVRRRW